jgi:outer membrane receptor protein involved in Fe transport
MEFDRAKTSLKYTTAAMIIAVALAAADPARAQADDAEDSSGTGDIVVTAQKRSENINSVAMSITALGGDDLLQRGVTDASQLVKVVPGFNFTQTGYATPVYTIRGIGFQENSLAASPAVSVYVDEIPLPFPAETEGVGLDLERVEVLKGPQGTLYGQNSTGGAVNYIAAKPTDTFTAGLSGTYGRFNALNAQAFISGPVTDTLKMRLSGQMVSSNDWQKSYTRSDTLGQQNKLVGRLLLDWQPASRLKITANLSGWRDRSDSMAAQAIGIFPQIATTPLPPALEAYPLAPGNARAADWDPGVSFKRHNSFYNLSLRADYDLTDDITFSSISAYQKYKRDQPVDTDGTAFQNFHVLETGRISTFFQELRLGGTLGGSGHWIVGANYERDGVHDTNLIRYAQSSSNVALGLPLTASVNQNYQRVKTVAVYGSADYEILPDLTLEGGLRYTKVKRDFSGAGCDSGNGEGAAVINTLASLFTGSLGPLTPGSCGTIRADDFSVGIITDTLDQDNLSWRAGVKWQAGPAALLYANISRGYKSGSYPTLSATISTQFTPVTQESVLAFEAGTKLSLIDRTLQFNLAGFHYDYSNKQIRGKLPDIVFGNLEALVNIPKSHITGFEASASWRPVTGLTIAPSVTYVASRIDGDFFNYTPLGVYQRVSGERFPYTPKWSANADVEYRWDLNGSLSAYAGGNVNYQGSTNGGFGELPQIRIRSYTLLDLRAGIEAQDGKWRLGVYGQNVTNVYYWTSASHIVDTITRFAGMPATYGVSFSVRY